MEGNTGFNYDDEEFDEVDLNDLQLLKNDSYGYQRFYENLLQKVLLKRGELTLTAAGQELATIVGDRLGTHEERILSCAKAGQAVRDDFEAFSYDFANQSVYYGDEFEPERRALQKVFLGFLEWKGNEQTGSVTLQDSIPEAIPVDVLAHLHETLETDDTEDLHANKLYQKYHRYRCAFSLFLLRSRQLVMEHDADPIVLAESDVKFDQFRSLMYIYWQQVYLGYALETQLEATTTFLNSRIPARYDYETLIDSVSDTDRIQSEVNGILRGLEVTEGTGETSMRHLTRDLMLYGTASRTRPSVSVTPTSPESTLTLGIVQDAIAEWTRDGWESVPSLALRELTKSFSPNPFERVSTNFSPLWMTRRRSSFTGHERLPARPSSSFLRSPVSDDSATSASGFTTTRTPGSIPPSPRFHNSIGSSHSLIPKRPLMRSPENCSENRSSGRISASSTIVSALVTSNGCFLSIKMTASVSKRRKRGAIHPSEPARRSFASSRSTPYFGTAAF
jgi:hypothetical protein